MRSYATVSPAFWTGDTGRQLRAMGTDVLAVAMYLMTSPHSNMIGLYYLPLVAFCHETGLGRNAVFAAMKKIESVEFAFYDEVGEIAWVPEMARYQIGEHLAEKDKKRASVLREIGQQRKGRFFADFLARYGEAFHLPDEWKEEPNKGHATRGMRDQCMPPVPVKDPDPVLDLPEVEESTPRTREAGPDIPGKPKDRAQAVLVAKHHAAACLLLAEWNAARKRLNPRAHGFPPSYENLGPIAARLDEGEGADERVRHVIAVCEANVRARPEDLKWFNPFTALVSNWTRNLSAVPTEPSAPRNEVRGTQNRPTWKAPQ